MRVGVDIMGGDFAPRSPIEGAILARESLGDDFEVVLIGDQELIAKELEAHGLPADAFPFVHAPQHIEMGANPVKAISSAPQSSIAVGMQLVKEGKISGFVSAGNTGAMLVGSIFILGKVEGVSRPTIGTLLPQPGGKVTLLCDIGANVDCKPETLYHFAILGSEFMKSVRGVEKPRVALLNIGEEKSKGPQDVQQAHQLFADSDRINFIGNVEGRDIYKGVAEVIVTDGFTGNIVLKFGESIYDLFKNRFAGDELMESFNFENYGGVPVLGVKGIVVIGHGISTPKAISNMIRQAKKAAHSHLIEKVKVAFENLDL